MRTNETIPSARSPAPRGRVSCALDGGRARSCRNRMDGSAHTDALGYPPIGTAPSPMLSQSGDMNQKGPALRPALKLVGASTPSSISQLLSWVLGYRKGLGRAMLSAPVFLVNDRENRAVPDRRSAQADRAMLLVRVCLQTVSIKSRRIIATRAEISGSSPLKICAARTVFFNHH